MESAAGEMSFGQAISQRGPGFPNRRSHRDDRRAGCELRLIHRSGPAAGSRSADRSGHVSFTGGRRGVSGIAGPEADSQPSRFRRDLKYGLCATRCAPRESPELLVVAGAEWKPLRLPVRRSWPPRYWVISSSRTSWAAQQMAFQIRFESCSRACYRQAVPVVCFLSAIMCAPIWLNTPANTGGQWPLTTAAGFLENQIYPTVREPERQPCLIM